MAPSTAKFAGRPDRHARDRAIMVERHLAARSIRDPLVLAAMGAVPREAFVPEHLTRIWRSSTISQPYIVARMIELLELRPTDTVLEVGAGSGYAAAVLSRIASKVFSIERHDVLANQARERIARLGYANAKIIFADGTKGLPEQAPFDAILVSAGGPKVPETLKQQLAIGGRLVIPVGRGTHQTLYLVRRVGDDEYEEEDQGAVTFVPLIGAEGWAEPGEAKRETAIDAESSGFAAGLLMPKQRARAIRSKLGHLIAEPEPSAICALAERFADRRVVLLGEATHGTAEFYDARAAITATAGREARLQYRGGGGRLARCSGLRCLCARVAPAESAQGRLHPLPCLDVAEQRGHRFPQAAESHQCGDRRSRTAMRILRPRRL